VTATSIGQVRVATDRESGPLALAAGFLATSLLVALAFLAFRNIYDDEISSLDWTGLPFRTIVHVSNSEDVHPPGMYVLSHLAYLVIPSPRWMTVAPLLVFYAGLSVFVLAVVPLLKTSLSRICFLLLATLHPQLIMWSNSIRWYGWWTGIALLTLAIALRLRNPDAPARLSYGRALGLGLLLGCLFYLNYITLIFAAALAVAMVLRYGWTVWRQGLVTAASLVLLAVPQLRPFLTVHLAGSRTQRSGMAVSAARLAQGLATSEAYLPWHPLALGALVVFLLLAAICLRWGAGLLREAIRERSLKAASLPLPSLLCFAMAFLVLVTLTGLGGKPRNALLLAPVLATAGGLAMERVRPRAAQLGLLAFLALWSGVGMVHLIGRYGVAKAGMNNRPEEVVDFVGASRGVNCAVLVTYDPELSFAAATSRLDRLLVITAGQNSMYRAAKPFDPAECTAIELYVVKSYLGGLRTGQVLLAETVNAEAAIAGPVRVDSLSFDPDARMKRRFRFIPGAGDLPDYRYVVSSGLLGKDQLPMLMQSLPHFAPADGWTEPKTSARALVR
jgi:hypothetical protein